MFYTVNTTVSPQTITATAEDPTATVLIKNDATTINSGTGSATGSATFANGHRIVTVKVTVGLEIVTYTIDLLKS